MDLFVRQALLESFVNDELLAMLITMLSEQEQLAEARQDPAALEALGPMIHLSQLITQNQDRARNIQVNAFICNKLFFRDDVLSRGVPHSPA